MNPYANAGNTAAAYKNQQVQNASPEQLTLMLYSGAARFISENMKATQEERFDDAHKAHLRAQDIMLYLIETLDMQYDISNNLFQLYEYVNFRMNEANLKKDVAQMEEAKVIVLELRDTWCEAMKKHQAEQVCPVSTAQTEDRANAVKLSLYTTLTGQKATPGGATPDGIRLDISSAPTTGK